MKYLYYPGCSLKGTNRHYEESVLAVFKALDVDLEELADWNCCGATAYMAVDEMKAFALAARNLALAEQQGNSTAATLMAPCSGCYLVLSKTQHYLQEYSEVSHTIDHALKAARLSYSRQVQIRHPLDLLVNELGLQAIASKVQRPLQGLKVACYYGCQIVRPYAAFDDQVNPTSMDHLMKSLGADTVDWPLKTRCCGGSLMGTVPDVGLPLSYILLKEAQKRGADVVATVCPLCQFNLECYQDKMSEQFKEHLELPVVYFTQLMGVALGIPERQLGLQRLFIPLEPVLAKREGGRHVRV
ncbi:MAG: disulfide reductase [Candidatus Fraserbacteria bacterium RBG_16_55_9]|uniref:Disulfide reductase n=1 Tax=Fraserbacteria sp. (strain RBG_16_55_9) TaxID=1817864 RepID=A0A1F5V143_FRAXR|nr:MAG: disulfide reductase [Candidatus Fraserbacteria bacterium RBG_16_55_9]